jgi:DNA-binding NtrC family response regulator
MAKNAYDALLSYGYPGNVRELKHAVERAVIFCKGGVIDLSHLPDEIGKSIDPSATGPCLSGDLPLESSIRCFEKQRILKALDEAGGRKLEAARILGVSRKVLWKKLKEHGIE